MPSKVTTPMLGDLLDVPAWLGAPTVVVLRAADRVEPFAVEPRRPKQATNSMHILGYPVYATGPVQGAAFAKRLAGLLLDRASYAEGGQPFGPFLLMCAFRPGVAFRIHAGARSVDTLLCFKCDQVAIKLVASAGDEREIYGDIHPTAFVGLAQEALPDVPAIQALVTDRHPLAP
jgi:hypothetical protein